MFFFKIFIYRINHISHSLTWKIHSISFFFGGVLCKGDDWESTARRLEIRVRSNRLGGNQLGCLIAVVYFCNSELHRNHID